MTISRNIIWCALVVLGSLNAVQAAGLLCYKGSLQDPMSVSLDNPTPIMNSSCYNPSRPTVICTYGFTGKNNGTDILSLILAYLEQNTFNVILLDWENEASGGILGQLGYDSAASNTETVGNQLCEALSELVDAGITPVHLVGHSLGAHVMGTAGCCMKSKGKELKSITGLDPAWPLFEGISKLYNALDRNSAEFVDIVHCSPGKYGTRNPSGTVDLWPNYNIMGLQPGCPVGIYPPFSPQGLCSHKRCIYYYSESLGTPTGFEASAAVNYDAWVASNGVSNNITYLGPLTNRSQHGNFYLSTYAQSPYAKGPAGLKP